MTTDTASLTQAVRELLDKLDAAEEREARLIEQLQAAEREVTAARIDAASAKEQLEILRGSLEAMLPGTLGSELEYETNAAYHACAYIAKKALETTSTPAKSPE